MSLSKSDAIDLARKLKADEPDLRTVRPFPVGDGKWLIEVKCGLWRWVVSSTDELEAGMRIIFGDPPEPVGSDSHEIATERQPLKLSKTYQIGTSKTDVDLSVR